MPLRERTANVSKLREAEPALETLRQLDTVEEFRLLGVDPETAPSAVS